MSPETAKEFISHLSRSEKAVYLKLAAFANRNGICVQSHRDIARCTSLSVSTVKRALLRLRTMGLITWTQSFGNNKARLENKYIVEEIRYMFKKPSKPLGL